MPYFCTATLQFFAHLVFVMFTRNVILLVLTNNYIVVSNYKIWRQLPFSVVRYFICFLSNKTLALSLLLEQRQGLLLIHSKRTGGGRILLFNAIMIYEPSSLFIFLFLCIHWSRNNEQMAEWLPPSSPAPATACARAI